MLASSLRLRTHVQEWQPHLLHLHTPAASLPLRALPRRTWPRSMKLVYTVHGYLHQWPPRGRADRLVQRIEELEARRTDLTLFQSAEDLHEAVLSWLWGSAYLIWVTESRILGSSSLPPASRPEALPPLRGTLGKREGNSDLLRAVERTPGIYLHVAGDALPSDRDSVADEVRAFVRSRVPNRVHLHGMLSKEGLQRLYGQSDALCLPSYREGVPRSVIEALAASRPVVGSRIRGVRELVQDGRNGLLFNAGDVVGLSQQLQSLCSMSSEQFAGRWQGRQSDRLTQPPGVPGLRSPRK